jgi:hypothetical protein
MDEVWPARTQGVGIQPEPVDGARDQVLHEHVCLVDEAVEQRAVRGVLDVELDAFLAAIEPHQVAGLAVHRAVVLAGEVTDGRTLDLDDTGAEIGELAGGEGCRDRLLEGDDGDAFTWVHGIASFSVAVGWCHWPARARIRRALSRTGRSTI